MTPSIDDLVSSAVGLTNVADPIRALGPACPDYVDCFTITTSPGVNASAEKWARAVLENTPTGRSAPFLWRLLGLRLGPRPATDHVQGWKITGRTGDWISVQTSSWYMSAHAVLRIDDDRVSLALFLQYDHPVAAAIWTPVSILHRRAVPDMLRQALTHLRQPEHLARQGQLT